MTSEWTPPTPRHRPVLDPGFVPAALWNRAYRDACAACPAARPLRIALSRPDGTVFLRDTLVLPHEGPRAALNERYVERLVKGMLWRHGGSTVTLAGCDALAAAVRAAYGPGGPRAFDADLMGRRIYHAPFEVRSCALDDAPAARDADRPLGGHLDGCRVGFDLGGSDRKAAAVVDGKVVFSEEVPWNPYFERDPRYHAEGIRASVRRAADHLPRVDAIGGSAAGVYVDNEVRVASLFRGVPEDVFDRDVRGLFGRLRAEWGGVPFEVVNDGEVTALAGAMSLRDGAVLGVSMGTSLAAGYCNDAGHVTSWLNELAFAPVDYRDGAPVDEWSGDAGCGVQYFSQQAVARLLPAAGIAVPGDLPPPARLERLQERMAAGDAGARRVYETIGTCFGYAIADYAEYYALRHVLLLGRATTGPGGEVLVAAADRVLASEFPELRGAGAASSRRTNGSSGTGRPSRRPACRAPRGGGRTR